MPQEYEQLKLKNQLCFPLYACARKITSAYTPYLKPLGLTYTQYIVFMALWENDSLTVGQLGTILHLDTGTLSPLLKNLEKSGYITRTRSNQDERVMSICLTQKGLTLKETCKNIPFECALQNKNLSQDELKLLYELLYKFLGGPGAK